MFSPKANGRRGLAGDRVQVEMPKAMTRKGWGNEIHLLGAAPEGFPAIMPEKERQPMIDQLIKVGLEGNDPLAQQDTREIIDELIARKQKFFAKHKRYIVDFQLQDTGKQFHLSVASTVSNPLVTD
jgi:hypothetical protein